jgi:16S rRNA (adenine1518-N6/adenine1519-N6)-dimethyltransferase
MQNESIAARTKRLLASHDLHAKKGLGQNFLIDGNILKKIAAAAELTPTDTVIEVGPGTGHTDGNAGRAGRKSDRYRTG